MLNPVELLGDTAGLQELLALKGVDPDRVARAADALRRQRALRTECDELRAESNRLAKTMEGRDPDDAARLRSDLADRKVRLAELEESHRDASRVADDLRLDLPNRPAPDAPQGHGDGDSVVVRTGGPDARESGRPAETHWEAGARLGIYDADRAAKLSGSGFSVLRGDGARLLRALVAFGLDLHRDRYEEIVVPHLVRPETLVASGHLPKFAAGAYRVERDDLWLLPTGESPLTAYHRDEVLDAAELPLRYMTYSSCFRREAGGAGKQSRGMQRLHEFHQVELVRMCGSEEADAEFAELQADAEQSLRLLQLPYRMVDVCTGDLSFPAARMFRFDVYSPGIDKWLPVSSASLLTDFPTRRSGIRVRGSAGTRIPYTMNATALAASRLWSVIVEHGSRDGAGRIELPMALHPYVGKEALEARGPH